MRPVAIIGAGFVGRGWAICFARSGRAVRLWGVHVALPFCMRTSFQSLPSGADSIDTAQPRAPARSAKSLPAICPAPASSLSVATINSPGMLGRVRDFMPEVDSAAQTVAGVARSPLRRLKPVSMPSLTHH